MQHDAADVVAFGQAAPFPGFAAVGASVHSGASVRGAAAVALAGANPDDVVAPIYGDVANGHGGFVIEYGFEICAVAFRVPQAAGSVGDVKFGGICWIYVYIRDSAGENAGADTFRFDGGKQGVFFEAFALFKAL